MTQWLELDLLGAGHWVVRCLLVDVGADGARALNDERARLTRGSPSVARWPHHATRAPNGSATHRQSPQSVAGVHVDHRPPLDLEHRLSATSNVYKAVFSSRVRKSETLRSTPYRSPLLLLRL